MSWNGIICILHTNNVLVCRVLSLFIFIGTNRGRGPRGSLPTPRGFPSRPRGSRLASPRLARLTSPRLRSRLEKSSRSAVTVTVAGAVAVTDAVAVRGSGYMLRFVSRKEREREREREREPGVSRKYIPVPHPSPRPAVRQDPDCRPVPTHVILTRTMIPGLYTGNSCDSIVSVYIPFTFHGFLTF